ncbi:PilZ domain-containing protein [bacterium AH-315-P07]|nr:PilZ domain-containing protein [bacterium AH-315-P07]
MSNGDERRSHPRSTRGFRVSDGSEDGLINHVDNISCSGVFCHAKNPVPEMTKMEIVLELPDPVNKHIEAEGIVVRCVAEEPAHDEFRIAILFTKLSEADQESILDYVEHDLN